MRFKLFCPLHFRTTEEHIHPKGAAFSAFEFFFLFPFPNIFSTRWQFFFFFPFLNIQGFHKIKVASTDANTANYSAKCFSCERDKLNLRLFQPAHKVVKVRYFFTHLPIVKKSASTFHQTNYLFNFVTALDTCWVFFFTDFRN